jgi:hypothetical protein
MNATRSNPAVSPDPLQAEVAAILAQLDPTPPQFAGTADATLVIPPWMVPHILAAPQDIVHWLHQIRAADFPADVFRRSAHLDPHRTAAYLFDRLQGRDRNDVQGNKEFLANLMMGLGIFAGLSMLIALSAAVIFMKLGPIGVVFGLIALLIGFIILLATAFIMVVITAVMVIIGHYNVTVTVALGPADVQAAGG